VTITTENVWREFSDRLRSFIGKRVSSPADADDLLADVFVKVHTRIDSLEDEARLAPWLFQITRNTLTDHYRRGSLPGTTLEGVEAEPAEDDYDAAALISASLRDFVDRLPAKYREALILTEFEGRSQVEMAAELGLSVSGAKSRVQRARAMLRDELLACCHFEFDRLGHVIDYEPRPRCCEPDVGHQPTSPRMVVS
jgi:RNA polymerase sigma-70 factor (ECF subfamily)